MIRRILATALPICLFAGCAQVDDSTQSAGDAEAPGGDVEAGGAEAIARNLLVEQFLVDEDPDTDVRILRTTTDPTGRWHARVQQTLGGVPVFEGEAIVHLERDGSVFEVTDKLVRGVAVDTTPALSAEQAIEIARGGERATAESAEPSADLYVLAREREPRLAWQVRLFRHEAELPSVHHHPSEPVAFVDAHTGEVLLSYDDLQTAATGYSLYSGTVGFDTFYYYNSKYWLETQSGGWITLDGNNGGTVAHMSDTNNIWSTTEQKAAVDVHIGINFAVSYYQEKFDRWLVDGAGGPGSATTVGGQSQQLGVVAHSGTNWENASWSPTSKRISFGDGDPTDMAGDDTPTSPWVSVDLVGHEYTHGVVQYTANLTYSGQSGALNEAIADIFGTMIEFYAYGSAGNWLIAEDVWTPGVGGDAMRDLANPHNSFDYGYTSNDNPDHYSERYTGSGDNGGVHINSGIGAKAFYLLAQGGGHSNGGSMTGIGKEAAAWIWYVALGWYMTSGSNFADARAATLSAAAAGYGTNSTAYNAVAKSWDLVGVK